MIIENNLPLISILMPCYNSEAFLGEAIESCINQSYQNWELIIIDDGSSDNSLLIARKFEDKRIHVYSQPNRGACVARNKALHLAKGDYVKFLDADDVLAKDCLTEQIKQIDSLKPNQIPFGDYDYIDKEDNHLRSYFFDSNESLQEDQIFFFFNRWEVLISAPLHKRVYLMQIGGFDETMKRGQESDLHFRLAIKGVEFVYCPCYTFSYREHNSLSKITNRYKSGAIDMIEYWEKRNTKCEDLLVGRYGFLPDKYKPFYSKYWFDRARDAFARKQVVDGKKMLAKSKAYNVETSFMKCYSQIGKIVGFSRLESLFRLRLKIMKK